MAEILKDLLFVTKADFADFREMSANITDAKINIFIRESQLIEVRGFLGANMYALMQEDFVDTTPEFGEARFNDLWYGTTYTNTKGESIRYNGFANSLIYFAFGRFLLQQQMNVSRFGLESIQDEISEDTTGAQIRTKAKESLSVAIKYQQDTLTFLQDKASTYPEYKQSETKPKNTSFIFSKL